MMRVLFHVFLAATLFCMTHSSKSAAQDQSKTRERYMKALKCAASYANAMGLAHAEGRQADVQRLMPLMNVLNASMEKLLVEGNISRERMKTDIITIQGEWQTKINADQAAAIAEINSNIAPGGYCAKTFNR
ncbi:MAG: hypothetical protein NW215_03340 [Hyphomicrobiales bacterium]|nr:hypothetical protein [Hyphomicrobiales bacterium]